MIERKFIDEAIRRMRATDYVKKEMDKAGIIDVNIQRTTLATRISIAAERPGLIIGKRGKSVKDLQDAVAARLGIENPQIELVEVGLASLEPTVIGRWIARMLERGFKPKRAIKKAADRVMSAGAQGCEIVVKGKLQGKGAQARKEREQVGYLKKAGDSTRMIRMAKTTAVLKQGIIGITVRIVPPEVVFPDRIDVKSVIQAAATAAAQAAPTVAEVVKAEVPEKVELPKAKKVEAPVTPAPVEAPKEKKPRKTKKAEETTEPAKAEQPNAEAPAPKKRAPRKKKAEAAPVETKNE